MSREFMPRRTGYKAGDTALNPSPPKHTGYFHSIGREIYAHGLLMFMGAFTIRKLLCVSENLHAYKHSMYALFGCPYVPAVYSCLYVCVWICVHLLIRTDHLFLLILGHRQWLGVGFQNRTTMGWAVLQLQHQLLEAVSISFSIT